MISCRIMTEADIPAAVRIINESYQDFPIRTPFSAWGLGHTLIPQYGLDLEHSFVAEVDGETAGVLLLSVDLDLRESFVFGWNVSPRFHRDRVGLELEKRFTRQHQALGIRTSWAMVASFRKARRYQAVKFRETRSLFCLDLPSRHRRPNRAWKCGPAPWRNWRHTTMRTGRRSPFPGSSAGGRSPAVGRCRPGEWRWPGGVRRWWVGESGAWSFF